MITPIASESDLVSTFGKPTNDNYLDWFNVYNFLQYAGSAYVVRPTTTDVKNAGVKITGSSAFGYNLGDLYNPKIAESTLAKSNLFETDRLHFFNKDVVAQQDLGIAVCSSDIFWNSPIAGEFLAKAELMPGEDDSVKLSDPTSFEILSGFSTVGGNQFVGTTGKLYTIKSIVKDSVVGYKMIVDRPLDEMDISKYYAKLAANPVLGSDQMVFTEDSFIELSTRFYINTSTGKKSVYVKAISFSGTNIVATLENVDGTPFDGDCTSLLGEIITSNSNFYSARLSMEYFDEATTTYVIPTGTQIIKVLPGFTYERGSMIDLGSQSYFISEVSADRSEITLLNKTSEAHTIGVAGVVSTFVKYNPTVVGINKYSEVFSDSVIRREKMIVENIQGEKDFVYAESLITFNSLFDFEPVWENGEFVVVTFKKDSKGKYEIVDTKLASYIPGARDSQGRNIFADDIFFTSSKYLYCKVGTDIITNVETGDIPLVKFEAFQKIEEAKGNFETRPKEVTRMEIDAAQELFADAESFDINLLVAHQLDINGMSEIAETRKDCVAIIAPYDAEELVNSSASNASKILCDKYGTQTVSGNKVFKRFGTYSSIYGNMKYQYDKFNDINRWVCIAGDIAGLYANTDSNRDPWWAPAGLERGKIKNAIKLAFNPNKANRDDLYVNAINPIMSIVGEGEAVVFGQKTATAKPSAFDRVNVRRLLIVIEKAVASAVKYSLFNFNDDFERNRLKGMIEPFLRMVKGRRGLYDFLIICDATNNTAEVVDANAMKIDMYLKPTKVAELIQVSAIVTRTDANFSEIVGQA